MPNYFEVFVNGYKGYAHYVWNSILHPTWNNYFYWLIAISLFFFVLEILRPWRRDQPKFRKDFWLDFFYMFFNFFLFSLLIFIATTDVLVAFFNHHILSLTGIDLKESNPMYQWPLWAVLLTGFLVRDFVQWWTHRLLHKFEFLWEFHKVHHSVQEMGFAAHLRYHWMETIVYRTIEYLPLALLGIGLYDFFLIHIFTLAVGHYNHSNISISGKVTGGILGGLIGCLIALRAFGINILEIDPSWSVMVFTIALSILLGSLVIGPFMKYLFNSPEMHIWHHAHDLPEHHRTGVNFGLTLAIWDYVFKTAYVPHNGRDIKLGFEGVEEFPQTFQRQVTHGFIK